MTLTWRRPILIGGIGISIALWIWESLHNSIENLDEILVLGAIAIGTVIWWSKQQTTQMELLSSPQLIERTTVEQAIKETTKTIALLEAETPGFDANGKFQETIAQITTELERIELRLGIIGGKSVGKSTLLKLLTGARQKTPLIFQEAPSLFVSDDGEMTAEKEVLDLAIASDLVLFVVNGDLTEPEYQILQKLAQIAVHIVLVFNKQDQYLPTERTIILQQLKQRVKGIIDESDVVAIATLPDPRKVMQHQPDRSVKEWLEQPTPEIKELTHRLTQILNSVGQKLVWSTTLRAAQTTQAEVKLVLNGVRRDRALPIIEQSQWIAAATAFANPFPALDLLATAAINAQLVVDLGGIYHQKFSLQQAQTLAVTLGKLMLQLGLVELSTQTISSILKSNAITYVAGGLAQGISAAYLTRLAGLSLIEYFQAQDVNSPESSGLNLKKLGETVQKVFQQNEKVAFLQSFVKQAVARLIPEAPQPQLPQSDPNY